LEPILLDSNVVIAYLDAEHIFHDLVRKLVDFKAHTFAISVFSMIECLVRKFSEGFEFAIQFELDLQTLIKDRLPLNSDVAFRAAEILGASDAHIGDAIILATSEYYEMTLWTLDRRFARRSLGVRDLLRD